MNAVDLIWMALKQGTLEMDYFLEQFEEDYSFIEEYYIDIESEFTKFNATTSEILDIWAEIFYDYIVYNDKNQDGIYSAGETDNPSTSGFSIYSGDEMCGVVRPLAWGFQMYYEYIDLITNTSTNITIHEILPFDKSVSEIASTIQFTPPTLIGDSVVSWDIEYAQFPIKATIIDRDKIPSEVYYTETNATYDLMSPGDFKYQFDYNLSENRADLDFTLSLSKISNDSFYNAAQGYGLCLPHYNFFVASFDLELELV